MDKYRVVVRHLADSAYVARVPEIEGCEAEGATRAEALANLEQELQARLENVQQQGGELPVPIDDQDFDGALSFKVTPALHRELVFMAREADVELEVLVAELLVRGVRGSRQRADGRRPPRSEGGRPGRHGGPSGQRYHDIMENRAEFMEYVRSLEGGGGGGGGAGRPGGRGRKPRG